MIKQGVYCGKKAKITEEPHGGGIIIHAEYLKIGFYYPEKMVGIYYASEHGNYPFIEKRFLFKGEITYLDNEKIEFYISDPYRNDRILYSGSHTENQLDLIAVRESAPNVIYSQDIFQYVKGTGELALTKQNKKK